MVIDLTKGELLELIGKAGKNDYFINQEFTLKFVQVLIIRNSNIFINIEIRELFFLYLSTLTSQSI
jgi:hypothetical protein